MTTEPNDKQKEEARKLVEQVTLMGECVSFDHAVYVRVVKQQLINDITAALSSRDTEIREVLEGLATHQVGSRRPCWCPPDYESEPHTPACLAARALWKRVQINLKEDDNAG